MKEIRVRVVQNNFPLRTFGLAMSTIPNNQDELLKKISKTIFSTDKIVKDEEDGLQLVFPNGIVRRVQIVSNTNPAFQYDYKISIHLPENIPTPSDNYSNLLNTKFASDITFIVEGQKILAHSFVLVTKSPIFSDLFLYGKDEPRTAICEMKGIEYDTMYDLLNFLYTGYFIDPDWLFSEETLIKCKKLLEADSIYWVENLKEECERRLVAILSKKNLIDCLVLADKYNMFDLREAAIKSFVLLVKECPDLLSGKFQNLQSQLLVDIVKALSS